MKVVGLKNREFQGQVVYGGGVARMMEVPLSMFECISLEFKVSLKFLIVFNTSHILNSSHPTHAL